MANHVTQGSTTEGLPVAPSLGPALVEAHVPPQETLLDHRAAWVCLVAVGLAIVSAGLAEVLGHLIGLITNLSFYGRWSTGMVSPANHGLGAWVILVPVIGGIVVGLMARYGSKAIRGHGIPEAMEQVLTNESRIPPRMTVLKPLSAAIAIGTGGPFGAEGPIIASGGALGSLVGQLLKTTAVERKTLLAAGAAAGMTATFGSPLAAVLLAIELLLFEYRARSVVPVAMACVTAMGVRMAFHGSEPVFAMPPLDAPSGAALALYSAIGALIGVIAVGVTRAVYGVEDLFEKTPLPWMWWPAIGGLVVGTVGYFVPRTFGVGYDNITDILGGNFTIKALAVLCAAKFVSWCISLGSGTSGGTLAPMFTIGGGLGWLAGFGLAALLPGAGIDPRMAALVGMAAIFAGASRALLAFMVFAFETTHRVHGLLPLLAGCTSAYFVSCLLMRYTIMTERIARRGIRVPLDYGADALEHILVRQVASKVIVSVKAGDTLAVVRVWITSGAGGTTHQGFPVLDDRGHLAGVITRRDVLGERVPSTKTVREILRRTPVVVYDDCSLREAVDHMVNHNVGRLPVISRAEPCRVVGIISRSDILTAFRKRLDEAREVHRSIRPTVSLMAALEGKR